MAGRDYGRYRFRLRVRTGKPALLADDQAIRLVWSYDGDLWSSTSTDGRTFSRPRRVPLPVSSSWLESDPVCLRDESGRFVLVFLCDRDAQHKRLPYICWSRDFLHWSAPSVITDHSVSRYDFMQDDRGRFIWVGKVKGGLSVLVSRDGYRWEEASRLSPIRPDGYFEGVNIRQRQDGRLELIAFERVMGFKPPDPGPEYECRILRFFSGDGRQWGDPEIVAAPAPIGAGLELVSGEDRSFLLGGYAGGIAATSRMVLLAENDDGTWRCSAPVRGLSGYGSVLYHPRWGYLFAWTMPGGRELAPHPLYGPFIMRGPSLGPQFTFDLADKEAATADSNE